jgi:GAF domain-containing protein
MGFVLMGRFDGQDMFTAGDEKLLMAMTHQAAIALETHRQYQQEIERQILEKEPSIGRQIQLGLLPPMRRHDRSAVICMIFSIFPTSPTA